MRTFDKSSLEAGTCSQCGAFSLILPMGEEPLCPTCNGFHPCKRCGVFHHWEDFKWWSLPDYVDEVESPMTWLCGLEGLDLPVTSTSRDIELIAQVCDCCL